MFEDTLRFFSKEPGYDAYSAIVSDQLDCDRLDFLSRDRYHCGIRSAALDLEWLLDSLRIEEVPIDPLNGIKEFSFVVIPKGISVVEEFVLSYVRMYQNVYFHKTTRSVQHLVRHLISEAIQQAPDILRVSGFQPILSYLTDPNFRTLQHYLSLDDSSVSALVHCMAAHGKGLGKELAERYLRRDLYKCMDLPTQTSGELKTSLAAKFVDALKSEAIVYYDDVVPTKSYKQYEVMEPDFVKNILVDYDAEFVPLGTISETVRTLPQKRVRLYFPTAAERDAADTLMKKCRA